jgi:hypothetical protein
MLQQGGKLMGESEELLCACGCGEPAVYAARHAPRTIRTKIHESDYVIMDCGYTTLCWVFRGKLAKGYATIRYQSRQMQAHRAMYEQEVGPIPDGLVIDHLCDVTRCINPAHLEAKTTAENLRWGKHTKLTIQDAREIRRIGMTKTANDLAENYGVTPFTIYQVRRNSIWKEL